MYQVARPIKFRVSLISRRGYQSFLVRALSALQSIQKQSLLPSFYINNTSKAAGELLALINPFLSKSSSVQRSTRSLSLDIAQRGLYSTSSVFLSTLFSLIVQSTFRPLCSSSLFPSSRTNSQTYNCRCAGSIAYTSSFIIQILGFKAFQMSCMLAAKTQISKSPLQLFCTQYQKATIDIEQQSREVSTSMLCTAILCCFIYNNFSLELIIPPTSSSQVFPKIILYLYVNRLI